MDQYPTRALPFYRAALASEALGEEAIRYFLRAAEVIDGDHSIPRSHWLRMRIPRRIGARFWENGQHLLRMDPCSAEGVDSLKKGLEWSICAFNMRSYIDFAAREARDEVVWVSTNSIEIEDDYQEAARRTGVVGEEDVNVLRLQQCLEVLVDNEDADVVTEHIDVFYAMMVAYCRLNNWKKAKECAAHVVRLYKAGEFDDVDEYSLERRYFSKAVSVLEAIPEHGA